MSATAVEIAGVRLTHPDKELYPDARVAKRDLARYAEAIAPRMLPHVARRLISLVRCPEGQGAPCFFQRHTLPGNLPAIHRFKADGKKDTDAYLYIEDLQGLIGLAQMGVLEIHVWGSHVDDIDRPDRMVFDLDPAEDVPFATVKAAALRLRDLLAAMQLESLPMLTGGKGIHVVVPLQPRHGWDVVKAFSGALAQRMAADRRRSAAAASSSTTSATTRRPRRSHPIRRARGPEHRSPGPSRGRACRGSRPPTRSRSPTTSAASPAPIPGPATPRSGRPWNPRS